MYSDITFSIFLGATKKISTLKTISKIDPFENGRHTLKEGKYTNNKQNQEFCYDKDLTVSSKATLKSK